MRGLRRSGEGYADLGVGNILENVKLVLGSDGTERVHVAWMAGVVHRDDALGLLGDAVLLRPTMCERRRAEEKALTVHSSARC